MWESSSFLNRGAAEQVANSKIKRFIVEIMRRSQLQAMTAIFSKSTENSDSDDTNFVTVKKILQPYKSFTTNRTVTREVRGELRQRRFLT